MRILADQDVYRASVDFLRSVGQQVSLAGEFGLNRASDEELLRRAAKEELVLLTRDKGFGAIVSLIEWDHEGVILLRVEPGTVNAVHEELRKFLQAHGGEPMRNRFIVIEPGRHRVRTTK